MPEKLPTSDACQKRTKEHGLYKPGPPKETKIFVNEGLCFRKFYKLWKEKTKQALR